MKLKKGLIIKGIAPIKLKSLYKNRKFLKMRYTDSPIISSVTILRDQIAIFSFKENPVGYLIKSKEISKIHKTFFQGVWKIAKS